MVFFFFFQAEDGIRDPLVTGVQTCALPISAGGEDASFAKALGDAGKIVVSNQKLELTWRNSEQLEGDLVEAVTALKSEPGGNIALSGSVSVVRQLLAAGLVDELHLLVHPIAVRKGMRLFDEGETPIPRSEEHTSEL